MQQGKWYWELTVNKPSICTKVKKVFRRKNKKTKVETINMNRYLIDGKIEVPIKWKDNETTNR